LTARLGAPWPRASAQPASKKNMQEQFFEADQQPQSPTTAKVNDTIAMYCSPLQRIRTFGAEALTEIDALSLLLGSAHETEI
jgi:hypothetical protein